MPKPVVRRRHLNQFPEVGKALAGNLLRALVFVHERVSAADLLLELTGAEDIHNAQADGKRVEAPGALIPPTDQVKETFADLETAALGSLREQNAEFIA